MCEEKKYQDVFHKMIAAGLGFISLSEEKARSFVNEMIKRGEISAKEGEGCLKNIMTKLEATGKDVEAKVSELVKKALKREHICTRDEIDAIMKRLEEIEKRIAQLEGK